MWRYLDTTDLLKAEMIGSGPVGLITGQYIDPLLVPAGALVAVQGIGAVGSVRTGPPTYLT